MSLCTVCNEALGEDYVLCASEQQCKLHFGACSGLQEKTWRKGDRSAWKCQTCRKPPKVIRSPLQSDEPVSPAELRRFMAAVNEKLEGVPKIKELKGVVEDLKGTIVFLSAKYDELLEKMEKVGEECKRHTETINKLEHHLKENDSEIVKLQRRIRDTEQYARNRNIEISGVEVQRGEDLKQVMSNIAHQLSVPFSQDDIDVIHRLPSRRGTAPSKIVAQFKSRSIRNLWLKQKNHGGHLLSSEVVPNGTGQTRVYLNTHLTSEWHHLLWLAKQRGRPNGYQIIWFQDNKIIAKKSMADTRAIYIYGEEDLEKIGQSV